VSTCKPIFSDNCNPFPWFHLSNLLYRVNFKTILSLLLSPGVKALGFLLLLCKCVLVYVYVCACVYVFQYKNAGDAFVVPPLGQHYSRRWAMEDLQEEQKESQRLGSMADPLAMWEKGSDKRANNREGYGKLPW